MLAPDAQTFDRSLEKEVEAITVASMAMLQYSPLVALDEESTLIVDVGASLTLFKGIRSLCSKIRADLASLGFTGHVSCAPTARAAWLLARCGRGRTLKHESMVRRLDRLPTIAIPSARPYAEWFQGLGCETIAELRRLPRPGLQRRCGRALLDVIDCALGTAPELFEWVEPPDRFHASIELFDRLENADLLLAGAQRLVVQLIGWLTSKHLAVETVVLSLGHERGRTARPPSQVQVTLAEPVWQADHIIRLLKEKLGKVELVAPVISLALEAMQVHPMAPPSEELFITPGGTEKDQVRVLELLTARLGPESVLRSRPVADYRPEVANAWAPAQEQVKVGHDEHLPPGVASLLRPTWLLAKPIPLLLRANRPFYKSPLRIVAGPERVEAAWWDDGATRDYFVAQGDDSSLYWIFRERIGGTGEGEELRYYLHGLFG